jgi:signal transduction histidine kinase
MGSADAIPKDLLGQQSLPEKPYETVWLRSERMGPPRGEIVRLDGEPPQYLFITVDFNGHRPGGPPAPPAIFFINFLALAVSVLLASGASVFILFKSMRSKAQLVDEILSEMRGGNLKARFPIKRLDEVGLFMQKFNVMADEIEHLVDRLKETELRRTRLLQELAHDLRTPVAALKTFVETLQFRADNLSQEHRNQLTTFSLKEINYLEHLVEDLLFLAQVTEPKYMAAMATTNLSEVAEEELNRVAARFQSPRAIQIELEIPDQDIQILGDRHLLQRLFRNVFENAFAFAKSKVRLHIASVDGKVIVEVADDGPGLSADALAAYGEKRATRVLEGANGRISVGLGSVIMKAVVIAHQGSLHIRNQGGAQVTFNFAARS